MEPVYKYFKPAWKSFYKLLFLMLLILILAVVGSIWGPLNSGAKLKWLWIAAIVVDVLIFLYIAVKRATMSLILKDNPAHFRCSRFLADLLLKRQTKPPIL